MHGQRIVPGESAGYGAGNPEAEVMIPLATIFLLAAPPADPLPDGKTIDSLSFAFTGEGPFGPTGHLSITAGGQVMYSHATAPATGSGGEITQAKWEIPKTEAAALLRKLVADGLLTLLESKTKPLPGPFLFTVTSGRWQMSLAAEPVPEKILAHLRPYLEKAHPALWKPETPPQDEKPAFTYVRYSFTEKLDSPEATLTVARDGKVTYTRKTHPTTPGGQKVLVDESWTIPAKDAAAILDGLIAGGLFELSDTRGGKFPNHYVEARAGRWKTALFPKEMSDPVMKHLRPLLEKADPATWKKP